MKSIVLTILLTLILCFTTKSNAALITPAPGAMLDVSYQGFLFGTCRLISGCRFGTAQDGFDVTNNETMSAELLISFRLDTSTPLFNIAAGENVPGTSAVANEALMSYGADVITNLVATFAGIDLVS